MGWYSMHLHPREACCQLLVHALHSVARAAEAFSAADQAAGQTLCEAICEPAFQSGALVALPIVLQGLADWFVRKADVGLVEADEPEKARKLAKTLSAFLHVGPGGAVDSLDV